MTAPSIVGSAILSPTPRRQRLGGGRRRLLNINYLFLLPATLYVVAMTIYPIVYNVAMSFRDVGAGELVRGDAKFVGLDNYESVLGDSALWDSLGVSLLYTSVSVILILVAGFFLALFFRRPFRGAGVVRALLLLAWILPSVVSGNIFRWMLDGDTGIVNYVLTSLGYPEKVFWLTQESTAIVGVVFATVWAGTPLALVLMLAGLMAIPKSLYEAGMIAGAGPWQATRYITIPMLRPVILTTTILSLIYTFKTFDTIYIMTRGGPGGSTKVLPIFAYERAFLLFDFGAGAVVTTMMLVLPLGISVVYYLLSRKEEGA